MNNFNHGIVAVLMFHCMTSVHVLAADKEQIKSAMIERIDRELATVNSTATLDFADDSTFLRRLSLDLVGRIPAASEVRAFLKNDSDTKYAQAIHGYLDSGANSRSMATFWRRVWVPQTDTPEFASLSENFELWIAQQLRQQVPYDQIVREIVTIDSKEITPVSISPSAFYLGNESKPENVAASSTRAFLGINLECAQCHNHPFASWSREQFWQTAAFFSDVDLRSEQHDKLPSVRIPDTDIIVQAAFLTANEVNFPETVDSAGLKRVFSDWMQSESDHYLSKNAVNRMWSHFLGEAIVEPMDDLSNIAAQSPDQLNLLNDLSDLFIQSEYDLSVLMEAIVCSNSYRLIATADFVSQELKSNGASSLTLRSTMVRGLTGEQLYESLANSAGLQPKRNDIRSGQATDRRREFVNQFYVERPFGAQRSITQSLALMNGSFTNELSTEKGNPLLASINSSPFMSLAEQIDAIYLATLSRYPRSDEYAAIIRHFESFSDEDRGQQFGNLYWVLINSSEFNTNR